MSTSAWQKGTLEDLTHLICEQRAHTAGTLIIGIDGPAGSGKTSLARALSRATPNTTVVRVDCFHLPLAIATRLVPGTGEVGACTDWRRFRDQVLKPLRSGLAATYDCFRVPLDATDVGRVVPGGGVVICEGAYSTRTELQDWYDLRIWVDCPRAIRATRLRQRDEKWGSDWLRYLESSWLPEEERYLVVHNPSQKAHILIDGERSNFNSQPTEVWLQRGLSLGSS